MNATDLDLLRHMLRENYTPEQVVTEIERVVRDD